jgi:hypothetical protein
MNQIKPSQRIIKSVVITLAAASFACGSSSDSDSVDPHSKATIADCQRLAAHLADRQLADAPALSAADRAQHHAAFVQTMGSAFTDSCIANYEFGHVACALKAMDSDRIASCLVPAGHAAAPPEPEPAPVVNPPTADIGSVTK